MMPPNLPPLSKVPFTKEHKRFDQQVEHLIGKGLTIADKPTAINFLSHVNYYRLSAYYRTFYVRPDTFATGTTFEQIRALYEFDRELRHLVGQAIETVEVSLRTSIAYHVGLVHGPFGHTNQNIFQERFVQQPDPKKPSFARWYADVEKETARSKEEFVIHFQNKHVEYPRLPVWTAVELMSFGTLSVMYAGLRHSDKRAIASRYAVDLAILESWIRSISYIRNLCFHHSRIWNRRLAVSPQIPPDANWRSLPSPQSLCPALFVIKHMASRSPAPSINIDDWKRSVEALIDGAVAGTNAFNALGLPTNWKTHPLWQ